MPTGLAKGPWRGNERINKTSGPPSGSHGAGKESEWETNRKTGKAGFPGTTDGHQEGNPTKEKFYSHPKARNAVKNGMCGLSLHKMQGLSFSDEMVPLLHYWDANGTKFTIERETDSRGNFVVLGNAKQTDLDEPSQKLYEIFEIAKILRPSKFDPIAVNSLLAVRELHPLILETCYYAQKLLWFCCHEDDSNPNQDIYATVTPRMVVDMAEHLFTSFQWHEDNIQDPDARIKWHLVSAHCFAKKLMWYARNGMSDYPLVFFCYHRNGNSFSIIRAPTGGPLSSNHTTTLKPVDEASKNVYISPNEMVANEKETIEEAQAEYRNRDMELH